MWPRLQDEWLAAYKKYHRPIIDFYTQKGVVISSTLYAPKTHAPGMPWDFAITRDPMSVYYPLDALPAKK